MEWANKIVLLIDRKPRFTLWVHIAQLFLVAIVIILSIVRIMVKGTPTSRMNTWVLGVVSKLNTSILIKLIRSIYVVGKVDNHYSLSDLD